MRRNPIIILAFATAATIAACETDLTPTIAHIGAVNSVVGVPHESLLVVVPTLVQLPVGGQAQLRTNAPDTLLRQLVWISQIPTIASVSQTGTVSLSLS